MGRPAAWYTRSAQVVSPVVLSTSMIPVVRAAVRSCVAPGSAGEAHMQFAVWIGDDMHVHSVAFVFPGVVRAVLGDSVDRQERAVQDQERLSPSLVHGLLERRSEDGEDLHRFPYVAVGRGGADAEPGLRAGRRCRPCAGGPGPAVPGGPAAGAATACPAVDAASADGRRGSAKWSWTGRCRSGRQAREASGGSGSLGRKPVYQALLRAVSPTSKPVRQVGTGSLSVFSVASPG